MGMHVQWGCVCDGDVVENNMCVTGCVCDGDVCVRWGCA